MRKKMMAAALGGLALVAMSTVSSQAEPSKAVQITEASVAADIPCWTSFNPSNPNGGPMRQYYKNCNSSGVSVTVGFVDGGGQVSTYPQYCAFVGAGQAVYWDVPYTFQGVNYQSAICRAF
ncbi:hypothetical protein ACWGE0_08495 [Lentzea sp. NPDC054927]